MYIAENIKETHHIKAKIVSSYDQVPDFYYNIKYKNADVSYIPQRNIDEWNHINPVLIDAPGARNDGTLLFEKLIPKAISENKNLLLLSNRVAPNVQQKKAIMKAINSPLLGRLTDQEIRDTNDFGNVRVLTYHHLQDFIGDPVNAAWISGLKYVVINDAHFFVSDANTNSECGYYLKLITQTFRNAIRIYMSATTWDVLHPLADAELAIKERYPLWGRSPFPRRFLRYVFDPDYSYVNLKFFTDLTEIHNLILKNPKQKWLILIDSKEKGRKFAANLGSNALFLDVHSKKAKERTDLFEICLFQKQVLITTADLSSSVNIHDGTLRNICVLADSRTSLIQMLGHKRCKPGESVNLYVYDLPERTIKKRHRDLTKMDDLYSDFNSRSTEGRRKMAQMLWNRCNKLEHLYFPLTSEGNLAANELAFYALHRKLRFYNGLLSKKITFRQAVCSWLGREYLEEA